MAADTDRDIPAQLGRQSVCEVVTLIIGVAANTQGLPLSKRRAAFGPKSESAIFTWVVFRARRCSEGNPIFVARGALPGKTGRVGDGWHSSNGPFVCRQVAMPLHPSRPTDRGCTIATFKSAVRGRAGLRPLGILAVGAARRPAAMWPLPTPGKDVGT